MNVIVGGGLTIQENLNALLRIESRGVKQAPFKVLMGATMPAVLVEIGFIDHPVEGKQLADPKVQDQLAGAIASAIEEQLADN